MVIIPKGPPALGPLHSFYVRLDRLIEHCQGAFGTGCIHLRAPRSRAAIFFENAEIIETCEDGVRGEHRGRAVLERLTEESERHNYLIDVFEIDPSLVHFWASLSTAEPVYADLSAEFTDLRGLARKMGTENLSGFIEVAAAGGPWGAVLLFDEGQIIGSSYSLGESASGGEGDLDELARLCREKGGTFSVRRLPSSDRSEPSAVPARASGGVREPTLHLAGEVLGVLEAVVVARRPPAGAFSTLLRAKFLAKAATYDFLDPFAAELAYEKGTVRFVGDADHRVVTQAVGECIRELAGELEVSQALRGALQESFGPRLADLAVLGFEL